MIVLRAKSVDYEVTYINLREKPDWFLAISPHGKVPVLKVGEVPLFESNAIAEYLDEVVAPALHPEDPLDRARHRAWTDFVADFAAMLGKIYYAKDETAMAAGIAAAKPKLARLEQAVAAERGDNGPYFSGENLCLVDAAYAPFFQRFAFCDTNLNTGLLDEFPRLRAWSDALLATDMVTGAVAESFPAEYAANLQRRGTYVATL
ncbi:MAG: glutathione S-transferase family protein [Gammaproteobacteria bacterium]|nr:glutathione S-transferase family protein [Gammaproteobacteria bacterium]